MLRESRGHDDKALTTRLVAGGNGVTPGTPGFSCAVCIGRMGRDSGTRLPFTPLLFTAQMRTNTLAPG